MVHEGKQLVQEAETFLLQCQRGTRGSEAEVLAWTHYRKKI